MTEEAEKEILVELIGENEETGIPTPDSPRVFVRDCQLRLPFAGTGVEVPPTHSILLLLEKSA